MRTFALDARTATAHFPGIGRYVASLARALPDLLTEDEQLVVLHRSGQGALADLRPAPDSGVRLVESGASPFSLRQQWTVPAALRSAGAEVYHSAYYVMAYRSGLPTVLTMYDLIPLLFPQYTSARARLLFRWMAGAALRSAARVIAISGATRDDVLATYRVAPEKVAVVPLAADPVFCPQPSAAVRTAAEGYGLPGEYVLYLGSNKPHKNLVGLIRAWSRIQPTALPLVIAGAWDDRYPESRQEADALGMGDQVRFLGPVPDSDLPALYSGASLFVFPSEYEGFGLPVLEAMACGTPVVCSNESSLPEVAGEAALYVDPTDEESIAQGIGELLEDPDLCRELRERGLARAKLFSWERMARETLGLYREVLG